VEFLLVELLVLCLLRVLLGGGNYTEDVLLVIAGAVSER
jgi:hypothetical protein